MHDIYVLPSGYNLLLQMLEKIMVWRKTLGTIYHPP